MALLPRLLRSLFRSPRLASGPIAGGSLRCGQTGREHAERRTGNVVQPSLMAELDRRGFPPVFAADADLQLGKSFSPALSCHFYQLADAFAIKYGKRILLQNAFLEIGGQELIYIVAGKPEGGLGKVVSAEREKLCFFGNLV